MRIRSVAVAALAASLALSAGFPAGQAHHSYAMFDMANSMEFTGVLKDVNWNNPHTAMIVEAPGGAGQAAEWHFEGGPPAFMLRAGIKRDDLSSRIADLNNAPAGGMAGSITAALFLRRFVADPSRWIHLDIYAWNGRDRPGRPPGAEAQGIRAVVELLRHLRA